MVGIVDKLKRVGRKLIPRKRYTVFTGTNTFREWIYMFRQFLKGGTYNNLEVIENYERQFAATCGVKHGISFGAGRMALYAILEALNINEGDEIIIPAFTCVVVPNAMIYKGIRPVYVDIDQQFFNIDTTKVEEVISPKTKAIYAQHTFGVVCDIKNLRALGKKYNLPVIEDAAHALGATFENKKAGSLTEISFFSTDHSKVINTHLGGIAVTNDDNLASRLREIQEASPFLEKKIVRKLIYSFLIEYLFFLPSTIWIGGVIFAIFNKLGSVFYFLDESKIMKPTNYPYPCRLSSPQAQLGIFQLQKLEQIIHHRREIVYWLEQKINWSGLRRGEIDEGAWLRYSFMVKDREKFEKQFGMYFELGTWFTSVVGGRTTRLEEVGYEIGSCPVAEHVAAHIVNFPTHLKIPVEKIQKEVNRNWKWLSSDILVL